MSRVRDCSHRTARRPMRANLWLSGALVAVLLRQAGADVITTYTPPLGNSDGYEVACVVQNHTNQSVQVSARLRDESGSELEGNAIAVPSGELEALLFNADPVDAAYCRFIFDGDDAAIRGYIRLIEPFTGNTRLVEAARDVRGGPRLNVTTYSPPVVSGPTDLVACVAHNVGGAEVEVTARMRDSNGALVAEMTTNVGVGAVSTVVSASDPPGANYCEFAFDANPTALRGYVEISNAGGTTRFLAAAGEAFPAAAQTLRSRAIAPDGGVVHCGAQNLDSEEIFVDADLLDADGAEIDSTGGAVLQPGEVTFLTNSVATSAEPVSCRFDLGTSDSRVRPFVAFLEPAGAGLRLIEFATATGGTAGLGATSFTPPLRRVAVDGSELECWLHNLTAESVSVDAALVDEEGGAVQERQASVQAGAVRRLVQSDEVLFDAHCRFTFNGSPAAVRGHIVLNDGSPRVLYAASIANALTPLPTPTASATPTPSVTPNPSATLTATTSPSNTPTPTETPNPPHTATSTPSAPHTATSTPTSGAPDTATPTPDGASTPTSTTTAPTATTATPAGTANPSPSETPPDATATASSTGTPAPAVPGDANCDGVVSAADLVAVVAAIASGAEPVCGEDANQDGEVDAEDLDQVAVLIFGTE